MLLHTILVLSFLFLKSSCALWGHLWHSSSVCANGWSNIVSSTIYNLCEKEKVLKTIFACSYGAKVKSFKQKQIVNNLLTLSLHCADLSQGSMELPNCKHVPQGGSNLWPPDWDNSVFFTSWDTEVHYLS